MFHYNLAHTGLSPYDTSGNNGTKKWAFGTGGQVGSSPAIGSDGTVYIASGNGNEPAPGHVYALTPNSSEKWAFATGGQGPSSSAIGSDGTIYVGSQEGDLPSPSHLYAINPNGNEKWVSTPDRKYISAPK
jgi:outer membrane protein assembly factor BamB